MPPADPAEGELLPAARPSSQPARPEPQPVPLLGIEQPAGHKVAGVEGPLGYGIACSCGRWQSLVRGLSSAAWAGLDYRRHLASELAAARGSREHTLSAGQVAGRPPAPNTLMLSCSCRRWTVIVETDADAERATEQWLDHAGAPRG